MAIRLFTDSSCDLSKDLRKKHNIEYFRQGININGKEYHADMDWEEYSPEQLYAWVGDLSNRCKTSQVPFQEYYNRMEPLLKNGDDILYIACPLVLSGSINTFHMVANELKEKYPDRKIVGMDGTKANMALGLLVLEAAEQIEKGASMEEVEQYVLDNQQYFNQVGSVETLSYLKAAGRVSGASAFFANMIGIKPMIMVDVHGNNYVYKKVKGRKNSLIESFEYIKANMVPGVTKVVYIGQAMAKEQQAYLKERVENELHIPVKEFWIGPIVGISCGPGMYGAWFKGKKVEVDADKEGK